MGRILHGADFHFGDEGIAKYQSPFGSAKERDECLMELWNQNVNSNDHVYVDGDFWSHGKKPAEWYLHRLKGHIHLIVGNHEYDLLRNREACKCFETIDEGTKFLKDIDGKGHGVIICHYPIAEWNGFQKGVHHIYAHIHNQSPEVQFMMAYKNSMGKGMAVNVGVTPTPRPPLEFNEWCEIQKTRDIAALEGFTDITCKFKGPEI